MEEKYLSIKTLIYKKLSVINTEMFAFFLLLLLCFQPLYSVIINVSVLYTRVALFYSKAVIIRLIGYLGLIIAAIDLYCKCYCFGHKVALKTFFGNMWTGLLAIVLVLAFISSLFAQDIYVSFNGDAYRYEGFASYVAYAGIFACASILTNESRRRWILKTFVSVSAALALLTLLKELTGTHIILENGGSILPYSGTFVNSNHYGYYLCVSMALAFSLYMDSEKWYYKVLYATIFSVNTLVLLLNGSFGPYLAAIAGMILAVIFYIIRKGIKFSWPAVFPIAVLIILSIFINEGAMLKEIGKTLGEIVNIFSAIGKGISEGDIGDAISDVNGGSNRFQIWVATIKVIMDYPILGCGTDNVHLIITRYGLSSVEMPHNEYLQLMANCGILAGIVYITALVWLLVRSMRNLKKLTPAVLIAGVAAATYALSAFVGVGMTITTCYLFFMLGLTNSYHQDERIKELIKANTGSEIA